MNTQRPASRPMPRRASSLSLDPQHEARFGPYAETYQPQTSNPMPPRDPQAPQSPRVPRSPPPPLPEAEVTVKAANSNTAPAGTDVATREASVVVAMARPQPQDTGARPATLQTSPDPADPNLLPNMVDVTLSRETATFSVPVSEAAMPSSLSAAIAKARAKAGLETPRFEIDEADQSDDLPRHPTGDDFLTPRDIALIGRMAPPAAE